MRSVFYISFVCSRLFADFFQREFPIMEVALRGTTAVDSVQKPCDFIETVQDVPANVQRIRCMRSNRFLDLLFSW